MNRNPLWKYIVILAVIMAAFIYASPNLFGEVPAVQIRGAANTIVDETTEQKINPILNQSHIPYVSEELSNQTLLYRFETSDLQLQAKEVIQAALGENYLVALNLVSSTPAWLTAIGAYPMKYGLDLRGGVHFLLQVNIDAVLKEQLQGDLRNISQSLREAHIRYTGIMRSGEDQLALSFQTEEIRSAAMGYLSSRFPDWIWTEAGTTDLSGSLRPAAIFQARQETMDQTMSTLRNRVNELGVSDAVVQQQGTNRISVDLPGIQDTTEAKNLIGKTATLEFHLVNTSDDPAIAAKEGLAPPDTHLYTYEGQPILLNNQVILNGTSIISASAGMGQEDGRPNVSVRLNGMGSSLFTKTTAENIGKPMAVVYVDVKSAPTMQNGKQVIVYHTEKTVISIATIQSALGNDFQITGLSSPREAQNLALLLRAGALPAPVTYMAESVVGATLGEKNIHQGVLSVIVGMCLVIIFMALYYQLMGLIANLALLMNLVLIVALLSLLGATLTLPGIAGIVLTVAMAVDANVLIFERIREELRRGNGVQSSIHAGYQRAFTTILDANITTLIVMMILFSMGSGIVKGIAITVTIGLITSMFTAIMGTRVLVNYIYGGRMVKHISIGM